MALFFTGYDAAMGYLLGFTCLAFFALVFGIVVVGLGIWIGAALSYEQGFGRLLGGERP